MLEEGYAQPAGTGREKLDIGGFSLTGTPRAGFKLKNLLKFMGPAFIVSVAYIDPPIFVLEHYRKGRCVPFP